MNIEESKEYEINLNDIRRLKQNMNTIQYNIDRLIRRNNELLNK